MITPTTQTVLFDLDGTLIDSVHDLAWTANQLRARRGLDPLPTDAIREVVTAGTRAMLAQALGAEHADHEPTREEFLDTYQEGCTRSSALFPGIADVLSRLDAAGIGWGIVTNKRERFTAPLLRSLGLTTRSVCVVSGDSTPYMKPDPAPLHLAATLCRTAPEACVYVGDAETDVQAAQAAGMRSIVALFGYIPPLAAPTQWGADHAVEAPSDLLRILGLS